MMAEFKADQLVRQFGNRKIAERRKLKERHEKSVFVFDPYSDFQVTNPPTFSNN